MSCIVLSYPQAYADIDPQSVERVIGVGRIQSPALSHEEPSNAAHFETPAQLAAETSLVVSQLAQPSERGIDNAASAIEAISLIQRFGEQDENGWYSVKASAYGPSSAGQWTALGTELTMTSMDIGIRLDHSYLLGQYVDLMYGDVILRCKIVDTGPLANDGRLFDLQPGVCTAFGAETPEFGWGVRTIKWRFVD